MRDDVARAAALRALEIAREARDKQGPKGDKGDPGEIQILNVAVPGPKGELGPVGPRGITGPAGSRGFQGDRGDPGPQGPEGKQGPTGSNGKDGKDGATGPKGERGPKGDKGDKGDIGAMPKFERKGLMFRFEKSPGVWGDWIVVPTGGGGGRDDKLTDRQKELVEVADLIKAKASNSGKVIGSDGTNLVWTEGGGGGLSYQGTWNASTNTPTLASGVGTNGYYYITATAGSTNLDGITDWQIGDWLMFNGTVWQKIDQSNLVTSVNGQTGAVSLDATDVGAEPADATILKDADIGVTVQGYSAVLAGTTASFTTADETKLDGIAAGAEVNVNADWNAVSGDAQILNKPTLYSDASVDTHLNTSTAISTQILSWTGTDYDWINQPGGSALTVQDEGSTLTSAATSLNFTGAGVTATNTGGAVTIDIPGGGGGGSTSPIPNLSAWMIGAF